jgi:Na+-transporting NADH:ubiquinone oxidoreductase subunit NqrF
METPSFKIHNRVVEQGTELSVNGESGRFKFLYVNESDGSITVYGGKNGYGMFRSFAVDRIRRVHTKKKMK